MFQLRRRDFIFGAAVLAVGVGRKVSAQPAPSMTPLEKELYEAAKKKDAVGIKKTLSKRVLAELENRAKKENKPFDEFLVDVKLPDPMPEVRNEKIEGDTGWLEIKGRGDNWRATRFVREDGEWKLDSE